MKLVQYKCPICDNITEEIYFSSEEVPEQIACLKCLHGKAVKMLNVKDNCHRARIQDQ